MAHETPAEQVYALKRVHREGGREYTNHTIPGTCLLIVTTETTPNPLPPLNVSVLEAPAPFTGPDPVLPVGQCDAGHCYCENPHRCGWHR